MKVENRYIASFLFLKKIFIKIGPSSNETKKDLSPEQQWQCLKQSMQEANEMLPKWGQKGRKGNVGHGNFSN